MNININGESRRFSEDLSIRDVLAQMGLLEKPVVVELNLEIVPKERWEGHRLKEGDRMEVIGFVGGGQ
jgi:thiamine biosynthesis protein ThiS